MEKKETVSAEKRTGLGILYTKPDPEENWEHIKYRDLASELRERYWIKAANKTINSSNYSLVISAPYNIKKHELGKNRSAPGDGFRYMVQWTGKSGMKEQTEWFEVTEVFEGVKPQEIEKFMRIENGVETDSGFSTDNFLNKLNLGRPYRAAQQRAADKVIAAIEKKLNKESYKDIQGEYGYGTLIVGLPLWFAMLPLDPSRVENAIDDFMVRTKIGIGKYTKQLRQKNCPFWRIIVVWEISKESIYEWKEKAKMDLYNDPIYQKIINMPVYLFLLSKISDSSSDIEGMWPNHINLSIYNHSGMKKTKKIISSPSSIAKIDRVKIVMELIEKYKPSYNQKRTLIDRIKFYGIHYGIYGILYLWGLLCFTRKYHLSGLKRWAIAKISPRRRIISFVIKHRALRLYKASQRNDPSKRKPHK